MNQKYSSLNTSIVVDNKFIPGFPLLPFATQLNVTQEFPSVENVSHTVIPGQNYHTVYIITQGQTHAETFLERTRGKYIARTI
jgi:hypothetical protein